MAQPPAMAQPPPRVMAIDDNVVRSMGMGKVFKDPPSRINSLDFSRTDDLLVTGSDDDGITIYNIATGTHKETLYSRKYGVSNVCFTHSNDALIYASKRAPAGSTPVQVHALRYHCTTTNSYKCYFTGHVASVNSLCMSPKNDLCLSAAIDKTVRLWDLRVPQCQGVLHVPGNPVASMDQQGLVFGVGTESGIVKLYDVRSYDKGPFDQFVVQEELHSAVCFADLKFSNDGKTLMATVEGKIYLLDAFTGALKKKFTNGIPEGGQAVEACFSSDNQYLFSGCDDRNIRVWHIESGREVAVWAGHASTPTVLKWAPRRLLVASACTAVALWIPDLPALDKMQQAMDQMNQ